MKTKYRGPGQIRLPLTFVIKLKPYNEFFCYSKGPIVVCEHSFYLVSNLVLIYKDPNMDYFRYFLLSPYFYLRLGTGQWLLTAVKEG